MPEIKAVLFDLDGTLIDTAPDFVIAVNQLRAEHQLDDLPENRIRATVSNGARALVTLALNIAPDSLEFESARLRLLELYNQVLGQYSQPFAGIEALLKLLRNRQIAWGIATNKPETYTTPLLEKLNLTPAADIVICPDHVRQRKPHPESIFLAAQALQCDAEQIIYIGDHQRDIECGNRAGAITVAALYGYIEANDDPYRWGAKHHAQSSTELTSLIETLL